MPPSLDHLHMLTQKQTTPKSHIPKNAPKLGTFLSPKWIKSEMKTTGGSEKDKDL